MRYLKTFLKKFRQTYHKQPIRFWTSIFAGMLLAYFSVNSLVLLISYNNKSLPNLLVSSVEVGGMSTDEIQEKLTWQLQQSQIKMSLDSQQVTAGAEDLGLSIDEERLQEIVMSRSLSRWIMPWLTDQQEALPLKFDEEKSLELISNFENEEFVAPVSASFSYEEDLSITEHKNGRGVDVDAVLQDAMTQLGRNLNGADIQISVTDLKPKLTTSDIESIRDQILNKASLELGYVIDGKIFAFSKSQLVGLLIVERTFGDELEVKPNKIKVQSFVDSLVKAANIESVTEVKNNYLSGRAEAVATPGKNGRKTANFQAMVDELLAKIEKGESHNLVFAFEEIPFESKTVEIDDVTITATYTYNVEVWGSVSSSLAGFKASAAETLASANGWSGGGISFGEVASGGSFTLVLASPDRVASASSGCSAEYSCRVGRYVIINDQRWSGATPAWNASGGGLRNYQHMVVNHEVGHWLGFDHRSCAGAGQLAPVMLQQSISLQGCKFNPWPTRAELDSL